MRNILSRPKKFRNKNRMKLKKLVKKLAHFIQIRNVVLKNVLDILSKRVKIKCALPGYKVAKVALVGLKKNSKKSMENIISMKNCIIKYAIVVDLKDKYIIKAYLIS